MPVLILDPESEEAIRADRKDRGINKWDEVWEGVYVVPSLPNDEHQEIQMALGVPIFEAVQAAGLGKVRAGVNVTDRHPDWKENFRCPDLVVYLTTTTAVNHDTHWQGGPDFLVEIISPGEDPTAKFDFYAKVKSREVMLIERDPWAVELHRLKGKKFILVARSELPGSAILASSVLPLTFRLIPGTPRPKIDVTHATTGK